MIENPLRKRREAASEKETEEKSDRTAEAVSATTQESTPVTGDYVAATTWDGLAHVGTVGEWWDQPPTDKDRFVRCVHPPNSQ